MVCEGDELLEVDGESVNGMDPDDVKMVVAGEVGTITTLKVDFCSWLDSCVEMLFRKLCSNEIFSFATRVSWIDVPLQSPCAASVCAI